jgi:hypothetical protein
MERGEGGGGGGWREVEVGGGGGGGVEVGGGRGLQSLTQRRRIHREDIRTLGPESQLGPYGRACRMGVPHPPPPSCPSLQVCPSTSRRKFS